MNALEVLLHQRIAEQGPLSFRDFMAAALYHPELGYYSTLQGFGDEGDFVTSPEVHPLFGALLARQAREVWEWVQRPAEFRILELGAGSGALAAALLAAAHAEAPGFARAVRYQVLEIGPTLRRRQQARLRDEPVTWPGEGDPNSEAPHFVLANEVLDAQPVHRVVWREGGPRELRVGHDARGQFEWVEQPTAPAAVHQYFAGLGLPVPEDTIVEVNLGLHAWAADLARRLAGPGVALVLDYGYRARDLLAHTRGTLLTYFRHQLGSDPLVRVGQQDISCHVDFTTLARAGHEAGLKVLGLTSQAELLRNLGIGPYARALRADADRRAVRELLDPAGLGRIQALFLSSKMPGFRPVGLDGSADWPPPAWIPSLPPPAGGDSFLDQWDEAFAAHPADEPR